MMQTRTIVGVPDIHAWPFSDGIQAFEDLDTGGIVIFGFSHVAILYARESGKYVLDFVI
jgi:hypothetical protein